MSKRETDKYKITDEAEMKVAKQPDITVHPGIFLRTVLLPQYGLKKVGDIAEKIGLSRPNLSLVLNGRADISRDLAYRFGALLNDNVADLLINYQLAWDKQKEAASRAEWRGKIARVPALDGVEA